MELNFNRIDDLNATFTVTLVKADYAESVEKELKKHQKQFKNEVFDKNEMKNNRDQIHF